MDYSRPTHILGPKTTIDSKASGRLKVGLKNRGRTKKKRTVLKNVLDGKGGCSSNKHKY